MAAARSVTDGHLPELGRGARAGELARLAPAGAVAFAAVIPVMEVVLIGHRVSYQGMLWAAGLTAGYLPGFLRLVHHVARGTRMRYAGWALAVIAVAAAVSQPLTGAWCGVVAFGVAALLVLRTPWSLALAAAGVVAQTTWVLGYGGGAGAAIWRGFSLVWEVAAVFSVVWLVGVMHRLRVAWAALADNAVARERARADHELRHTLGNALGSIADRSDLAAAQLRDGSDLAPGAIAHVVQESRTTLAEARRIIGELSRGSVRFEVESARALLTAAGIRARVTGAGANVAADDEDARAVLRTAIADLLVQPPPRGAEVTIGRRDGRLTLAVPPPEGAQ